MASRIWLIRELKIRIGLAILTVVAPQAASCAVPDLVELLRERLALAEGVAQSKAVLGTAIEDLVRERQILLKMDHLAVRYSLSRSLTRQVFQAQIDANKAAQTVFIRRWRGTPLSVDSSKLQQTLRARIDRINRQILASLAHPPHFDQANLPDSHLPAVYAGAWVIATKPFCRP